MANVNSLMSTTSSTSSIYGNRNILTGLASGLDTEAMIENSIQGYKLKIQNLIGQQTKLTWKQDAMRSISDKMVELSQKYTSYTSKTNLASPSYFKKAVTTTTGGKNADLVSATGRSTSDVQLNAVKQLASAARYSTAAEHLDIGKAEGSSFNLSGTVNVGKLSGSMDITVGSKVVSLSFGEADVYRNAQEMVKGINEKLKASGDDNLVTAQLSGNSITFRTGSAAQSGDSVWISSASSSLEETLGFTAGKLGVGDKSIKVPSSALYESKSKAQYLSGKSINVTLDGVTKSIKLGNLSGTPDEMKTALIQNLNANLQSAFGEDKVTVTLTENGGLKFNASQDSNLNVTSDSEQVSSVLGLGKNGVSNYLNTNKTLREVLGENMGGLRANGNGTYSMTINGVTFGEFTKDTSIEDVLSAITKSDAGVKASYSKLTGKFTFEAAVSGEGGRIDFGDGLATKLFGKAEARTATTANGSSTGVLVDEDGKEIEVGKDENGVAVYLKLFRGEYYLSSKEGRILMDNDTFEDIRANLNDKAVKDAITNARKGFSAGKDAIFNVKVNGEDMTLTRSSNTIDLDGMTTTLNGIFNEDSISDTKDSNGRYIYDKLKVAADTVVTFTTKASDELVNNIKSFVDEYNAIIKDVRSAYTTQPLSKNSNVNKYKTYDPLTDEEKENMSEKQIEAYEEKAKTGLLFGDSDLRRAYDALRNAISAYDLDRKALESIGLTTHYENGVTTLKLDEDMLRAALDSDPDRVEKIFTQSKATGASSDGLMAKVRTVMDTYASTTVGKYGALVQKAGSKSSAMSLLNNSWQKQIDSLDTLIDRWQSKMSDKIDYYTRQFTALEKMMEQFNSQSSSLAGLMGY